MNGLFQKIASTSTRLMDLIKPMHPPPMALAQPEPIGTILPYEDFIDCEGLTLALLSDGSLGAMWEIGCIEHEIMTCPQITNQLQSIVRVIESVAHERATFQLIWDSAPSKNFGLPSYAGDPKTYAQMIMVERIKAIKALTSPNEHGLTCTRRQLFFTFRWQRLGRLGLDDMHRGFWRGSALSALEVQAKRLQKMTQEIREQIKILEDGFGNAGLSWERCDSNTFMRIVRRELHSSAFNENNKWHEYNPNESIKSQSALEFIKMTPWSIQLGDTMPDTVQVLTWAQQSVKNFDGMMAYLLQVKEPIRVVLTLRQCSSMSDVSWKEFFLRGSMDARGKRQLKEIVEAQGRISYGEKPMWLGLHIFVRNQNCSLEQLKERNAGQSVAKNLKELTRIPFILENYAVPALFGLCLPLGYTSTSGTFTRRERRVLSANIGSYLPAFGGFSGTKTKSQIMTSRSGEPIYLSARDSQTSPHIAVLASSGGGKSFWLANYICAERALYPNSLDFIIDNKTSYEVLAKVFGEEGGYILAKPPITYPNIFLGEADDDRLNMIVSILRSAISLASPNAELTAEHTMILKIALKKTFGANYIDAGTEFIDGNLVRKSKVGSVVVPRLSDVVNKFTEVCQEKDMPAEYASWLRAKLSPFFGAGPYAAMFDQECIVDAEPATPSVTLFDLDGVFSDPILCTLTSQICISEVLRQVKRPENRGKRGRLVIEEAGVLGAKSPELEAFARDAWKTFRKLKYSCIGLTNEVDDYLFKPAPRTMWQISPTKVVLRMLSDELTKACSENKELGIPRLIPTDHLSKLIGSLRKKDGVYSQAFWWGDETQGTFIYSPTGFDYWLAASEPEEVDTVDRLAKHVGGYWRALYWLAKNKPNGFRTKDDEVRAITDTELLSIPSDFELLNQEAA